MVDGNGKGNFIRPPTFGANCCTTTTDDDLRDARKKDVASSTHWKTSSREFTKPETLKHVLDIDQEPVLRPAKIVGYALSSWGQYPALIDGDTGTEVSGYAYEVQTPEHENKLAYYETNAYKLHPCQIDFSDEKEPRELYGKTFMYAGDAEALKNGRFDRRLWESQMGFRLPDSWKTSENEVRKDP
ncbi:hypothetical protein F4779DRAFT_620117 [Xylariaceae sp. FL0662B]|nr:hypothetical protein F4779DRAFT_620117 [Xylariaceae sp. FL0662B]